jgi:hypothetical protein
MDGNSTSHAGTLKGTGLLNDDDYLTTPFWTYENSCNGSIEYFLDQQLALNEVEGRERADTATTSPESVGEQ